MNDCSPVLHVLFTYLCVYPYKPTMYVLLGTYVKEFVHGDLGRTIPSIFSVLKCHVRDLVRLYRLLSLSGL